MRPRVRADRGQLERLLQPGVELGQPIHQPASPTSGSSTSSEA
jgi:hypothetical protein